MIEAVLAFILRVSSHPFVQGVMVPAVSHVLAGAASKLANRIEESSAIKAAKAAKTAQELRDASIRLSDASRR